MNIQVALKKWKDTVSIESLRVEDIVEMLDCMAEHILKLEAAQQSVERIGEESAADEIVHKMADLLVEFVRGKPANRLADSPRK